MREIDKWPKRFKYRRLSKLVIIICFFLSIAIIGLTYYGSNVGNFLITIEESAEKNMSLSDSEAFTNPVTLLSAQGLKEMQDCTLSLIPVDIEKYDGQHNDVTQNRFIAYTFYAKNVSTVAITYSAKITITSVSKRVDSAVRVMLIRNGVRTVYAKPQESGAEKGQPEKNLNDLGVSLYSVVNFKYNTVICEFTVERFQPLQTDKYTVVIWLEGWDPDCTDDIKGGTLKMEMLFAAK